MVKDENIENTTEDTEGHGRRYGGLLPEDSDVEGHKKPGKNLDAEDDVEGHKRNY